LQRRAASTCSIYWARWQFPEFRHACTSEQVACCPSSVHPQPNCEHHHCWLPAIDLYVSELLVTRVPGVAQAESSVHAMIERNVAFAIFFMIVTFRGECRPERTKRVIPPWPSGWEMRSGDRGNAGEFA